MSDTPFVPIENSEKVACRVCGSTGYGALDPSPHQVAGWQRAHLDGHIPCPECQKPCTAKGISQHRAKAHRGTQEFPRSWVISVCRTCGRKADWPFCEHREPNGEWFYTLVVRGSVPVKERRAARPSDT